MKKIKFILTVFLLLVALNGISQTKELIYIRIQEKIATSMCDSYIRITYPNQTSKLIELSKLGNGGNGAEENGKTIQKEISNLINDGYEISSCSVGGDMNVTTTILVLIRKKEK